MVGISDLPRQIRDKPMEDFVRRPSKLTTGEYDMLLLEGNDLWVNLKTSFVDIDQLLLFLKKQKFSGYLHSGVQYIAFEEI